MGCDCCVKKDKTEMLAEDAFNELKDDRMQEIKNHIKGILNRIDSCKRETRDTENDLKLYLDLIREELTNG